MKSLKPNVQLFLFAFIAFFHISKAGIEARVNLLVPGACEFPHNFERCAIFTSLISKSDGGQRCGLPEEAFSDGCLDSTIFVQTAFTPNGDGQNDVLYVLGLKTEEFIFSVHNRWGELMFETKDKKKGWDGTYKGNAVAPGVYYWNLKVKCFGAEDSQRSGIVTLMR